MITMAPPIDLLIGAFGATLVAGCGFDLRERRIPNPLTYGALACALVLRLGLEGYDLQAGILGAAFGLVVGFILFAAGALGAGDAKLFMAVGAFLGPDLLVPAMALSAVAGGMLGVFYAWREGLLLVLFVYLRDLAIYGATFGGPRVTTDAGGFPRRTDHCRTVSPSRRAPWRR